MTFFKTPAAAQSAQPLPESGGESPAPDKRLGQAATAAILLSLVIMIGAGLLRANWMPPALKLPSFGPPWELDVRVSPRLTVSILWLSAPLAAVGVGAALVAIRRGLPVPMRILLVAGGIAAVAMTVLPPAGSTDTLDYAVYGHIVALGHSPYVMTPLQYRQLTHAFGVPVDWQKDPSVYGPLATAEQYLAAKLGGASLARTAFWLKLINLIGFAAIAYVADRLFRRNPAARARAHLLWTANPLVLWAAIAGGHVELLGAVIGVAGILIVDRHVLSRPVLNALVAGICVGAATDITLPFALFGLALAWSLWRAPRQLLAATAGGLAVLAASYAWAGIPAIKAVTARAQTGEGWGYWGFVFHHLGIPLHYAVPAAVVLFFPVAWLALTRMPQGLDDRPAARAALALSLAWLLVWPHQFAWYSLIVICVLIFFPASRLDWLALTWLGVMTYVNMPGTGVGQTQRLGHTITHLQSLNLDKLAPLFMLGTLVAMLIWCFNRQWNATHTTTGPVSP